jgi:Ca2+-binding EF-hand superfamily protein
VDKSGTIDRTELQNALTDFGYVVTPQLLNILQHKYGLYGITFIAIRTYSSKT